MKFVYRLRFVFLAIFVCILPSCASLIQNHFNRSYKKICDIPEASKLLKGEEPVIVERRYSDYLDDIVEIESNYFVLCGKMQYEFPAYSSEEFLKMVGSFAKSKSIPYVIYSVLRQKYIITYDHTGQSFDQVNNIYELKYYYPMTDDEKKNVALGLKVKKLDKSDLSQLNGKQGVKVDVVYNNSLAFNENIIADDIIVSVNGNKVAGLEDWKKIQSTIKKGDDIDFQIVRKGKNINKKFKYN